MFGILSVFISYSITIFPKIEDLTLPKAPNNGVAITFDDGPHPTHTDEILDILREKKVHATFFLIWLHIPRDEKAILREIREWHIVGGHSFSHQNFSKLSLPQIGKEVLLTHIKIASLTGKYPRYFRFPYGVDDIRIRNFYKGKFIGWNVDAYDWRAKNPKLLAEKIVAQTKTGSIILLHDIKWDTVKALPFIIDGIRAKKLEFTPLSSLLVGLSHTSNEDIIFYSKFKTWALHNHLIQKKIVSPSTEEILEPLIVTEVSPW